MTYRTRLLNGSLFSLICTAGVLGAWWLAKAPPAEKVKGASNPPPAIVPKPLKEEQINVLTLSPEATERLSLRTEAVKREAITRVRIYGGEVTVPAGRSITVAAPVAGHLRATPDGTRLPGQMVKRGQALFQLLPLLTPEARANLTSARIEAEGEIRRAQTQIEAARIALDRAKRVFASEAGSRRAVDETQTQYDLALKSLQLAEARNDLLAKVAGEVEGGTAAPLPIESPCDGILRSIHALPNQDVPAGTPLVEVADLRRLWVRVPVYVGDLAEVNAAAEAAVGNLTSRLGSFQTVAQPVDVPPTADPTAATVDLYYEIDNQEGRFRPGQRVGATVSLFTETESLTVPWASIVLDIHGGAWVYEQLSETTFTRRRVQVRYVVSKTAVLATGPLPGSQVVTAGAAELFGAETGFTK